jgi:hypothetical protein
MKLQPSQVFLLSCLVVLTSCTLTHTVPKKRFVVVEAKRWSRIDGNIHLSSWTKFNANTLDLMSDFKPVQKELFSRYGGDLSQKIEGRGFFYTKKIDNKWWLVDPEGYLCLHIGINGVRPGTSDRNEKALSESFATPEKWIVKTSNELNELGFNGAGCWSDVPLIKYANQQNSPSLVYTLIWSFYSSYNKQRKQHSQEELSFAVFDTAFAVFCDSLAQKLLETSNDPNLLGHFSDNELAFNEKILDEYLSIENHEDPNYKAAQNWLTNCGLEKMGITDSNRRQFLGLVAEKYYQVVSLAINKYDPNHLYLGSRLHGKPKHNAYIYKAAEKFADILSINYYGHWEPSQKHFAEWAQLVDKPLMITEFYTKGEDSGMPNITGAGWTVKTQNDRGVFYENFCLKLLQMNNCVGWHWFRYMDNDPTDLTADSSNNDSNKGVVDNYYRYYLPLVERMRLLNLNRYRLIEYFQKSELVK